jgi:hypothetical protein
VLCVNKPQRLTFKLKIQLGELFIKMNDFKSLSKLIKELNEYSIEKDDVDYFELLSLEIQYHTEKINLRELKVIFEKFNT